MRWWDSKTLEDHEKNESINLMKDWIGFSKTKAERRKEGRNKIKSVLLSNLQKKSLFSSLTGWYLRLRSWKKTNLKFNCQSKAGSRIIKGVGEIIFPIFKEPEDPSHKRTKNVKVWCKKSLKIVKIYTIRIFKSCQTKTKNTRIPVRKFDVKDL